MPFNIPLMLNITNMFGNWLNRVAKKTKDRLELVCALFFGAIWKVRNDFVFNKKNFPIIFAGYPYGYPLDPYVVLSTVGGGATCFEYWVQPTSNNNT
jgi:hypothetical protein